MANVEFLSVGEFERTMKPLRDLIADGFKTTHDKQDATNGRLLRAEESLAVLNKARLIEVTTQHERRLTEIEITSRLRSVLRMMLLGAAVTVGGGIVTGVTVGLVKYLAGW